MFNTFSSNSENSIRNHFIFFNNEIIADDFIISCSQNRSFFQDISSNNIENFFNLKPSNSLSTANRHCLSFQNEYDFNSFSFEESYKNIVNSTNLIDVYFQIRQLPKNSNDLITLGFHTSYLRLIYSFLDDSIRELLMTYNPNKLDLFLSNCIEKNILSIEQINKVSDKIIIPFILSDFFLHLSYHNKLFEYFLNYFSIYGKINNNLNLLPNIDENLLSFHYKKVINFIIKHNLDLSSIGSIFYHKNGDTGVIMFERLFNFLNNHFPLDKTLIIKKILSLQINGSVNTLNYQSLEILSFLALNEPELLMYFISHHVKEKQISNRPLAALIKQNIPINFIQQYKNQLINIMPDLFDNFSWNEIITSSKSSEIFTLPFHKILFSINVFHYYNEEHIFQKYLDYIKLFFLKINLNTFINYHLKTSAFSNKNYIEIANITISFDGQNKDIQKYIALLNQKFFTYNVIDNIMKSNCHLLIIDSYVRELVLLLQINEQSGSGQSELHSLNKNEKNVKNGGNNHCNNVYLNKKKI